MQLRGIYDETMTDLIRKGFGGIVQQIDHDYKSMTTPTSVVDLYTPRKTKNEKQERPATLIPFSGGPSSPNYDEKIYSILNKSPGLTAGQLQKICGNKHQVSESLRSLKEHGLVDYDDYFRFYPKVLVS